MLKSQRSNYLFFALLLVIISFGLNILLASSSFLAVESFGNPYYYFRRQIIFTTVGISLLIILSQANYRILFNLAWPLYIFSMILLVAVFIPGLGKTSGGASRWINILGLSFQPSDLARFTTLNLMARIFSREDTPSTITICFVIIVFTIPLGLIAIEPDFGTALHLALVVAIFTFLAGVPLHYHLLGLLAALPLIYQAIIKVPFRLERVKVFLDPWKYRYEGAYQLVASFRSFIAGGAFGQGLGEGIRRHNLQARHTDFILAIVAEDLGLLGIILVLLLIFFLTFLGYFLTLSVKDTYSRLLAQGIITLFIIQACINISVTMGLIPTTGINLPFFSYGGTSLIVYCAMMGIFLSILRLEMEKR